MKVTLHGGKGSAKHNDHLFKSVHIDPKKKENDIFYFADEESKTCEEAELKVYTELYSDALAKQNEKHRANRQYNRVRKMTDWIKAPIYSAREEVLQIGDMDDHATMEDLEACILELEEWKEAVFGSNYKCISIAIHDDETTPHAHSRGAWFYYEDGVYKPGLARALEDLGIPLPDPSKPVSKKNNRSMIYTAICREKWQQICISHGYDIDCEPDKDRDFGNMPPEAWKAFKKAMAQVEARERALEARERALEEKAAAYEKATAEAEQKALEAVESVLTGWSFPDGTNLWERVGKRITEQVRHEVKERTVPDIVKDRSATSERSFSF